MSPDEHVHDDAHAHEHSHGDVTHSHGHTDHDHEHAEHEHTHTHEDGTTHAHPHVHQVELEEDHEHDHQPAAYSARMTAAERSEQLAQLADAAHAASGRGDGWSTGEAWRRYELVRDGGRDPDELIAEGIALSRVAVDLARQAEHHEA